MAGRQGATVGDFSGIQTQLKEISKAAGKCAQEEESLERLSVLPETPLTTEAMRVTF